MKEKAALAAILAGIDLEALKGAQAAISEASEVERDKFENLSEGLQAADSGQAIEAMADLLEEQGSELESAIDSIEQAISALEEAL